MGSAGGYASARKVEDVWVNTALRHCDGPPPRAYLEDEDPPQKQLGTDLDGNRDWIARNPAASSGCGISKPYSGFRPELLHAQQ